MDTRISVSDRKVSFIYNKGDQPITVDDVIKNGNRMMCGNGLIGYRGTTEETINTGMPATIVNGIYDKQGKGWREPVNFPNGLYCTIDIPQSIMQNEKEIPHSFSIVENENLIFHIQSIDYKYGVFSRESVFQINDTTITITSERFVSMNQHNLICCKYSISSDKIINAKILHGIDCNVYDINGPHFEKTLNVKPSSDTDSISITGSTNEEKIPFSVSHKSICPERVLAKKTYNTEDKEIIENFITLTPNKTETWYFFETITTDNENTNFQHNFSKESYDKFYSEHCKIWDEIWKDGDVVIEGDDEAQNELRYSLYQLHIIAPNDKNSKRPLSIPARGLSGQTYKGAVFWDTEMFISPYFLYTRPEIVRSFIEYRIKTLSGAKRKAKEYGFEGAFYAWESQETGDDACSDFNVTDVFTGRPQKTYFRDKQIHISAAIVFGITEYLKVTDDKSILYDGALEVILECAKFYLSTCVYIPCKNRYELHDVIGPDEYHERVNNNAYTNRIVKHTLSSALNLLTSVKKSNPTFFDEVYEKTQFFKYKTLLKDVTNLLYIPQPNKDGIIEQFDGYFNLEDCSLQDVRSRLLNEKEYWGGSNGVASQTQIIKQADTILMLNLFPDDYQTEIKEANFKYYEPRTEHGSSLSHCMYALIACKTGNSNWGYPFFRKSASIDITGESKQFAGLIYIGGTHPAASGGAWISVIKGFCGFSIKDNKPEVFPSLPQNWTKVQFIAKTHGKKYQITITKDGTAICQQ
jgi:trehalose/maltose hydrolase-like predicted phosphorylase